MKNNQNNKYKHVLFIYSTQGVTSLSLAVVYGLISVTKAVVRPFLVRRNVLSHLKGSTSRARALSLLGDLFTYVGNRADSTSRARALNLPGFLRALQLTASSTSRARALSLQCVARIDRSVHLTSRARALSGLCGQKLVIGLRAHSTSRARALNGLGVLLVAITILAAIFTAGGGQAQAATSNTLNFQGRLLTNTGGLVPDGTYNMQFDLYYQASGGSSQWTEDRLNTNSQGVVIKNGYFSVYLGEYDAIPALNWSEDLYLGMTIRGTGSCAWGACTPADSQMTPRFKLTAVPYAFRAANVASSGTNAASTNSDGVSITTGNAAGATSNSGNITVDTGTATGTTGTISLGASNASALTIGNGSATTTLQGQVAVTGSGTALAVTNSATIGGTLGVTGLTTAIGGLTVGTGSNFINQGSTLFSSLAISNVAGGGNIGSAATTVDVATTFNVSQTTGGQTLTLPNPTIATAGRIAFVNNVGSTSFTMYGSVIAVGQSNTFIWNGTNWVTTVSLSGSVVNVIGTIDSASGGKSADGARIEANAIYLQTADDTYPGLVSTSAQTFAGAKTFNGAVLASGGLTVDTGQNFINQGSTLFSGVTVNDVSGGGNIGSAATTVDIATTFNVNQTTSGQTLTLANPTTTTSGRIAFVNNVGSVSFEMYGSVIASGQSNTFIWNGTNWITTVSLSGSVVNVIGTIDSQTKSTDGAVISGNAIYLQTADATSVGLVSTSAQTFAGAKTFNDAVTVSGLLQANLGLTASGAATNLNVSSNFDTNINTGTSTGAVSIGNSASGAVSIGSGGNIGLTTSGIIGLNGTVQLGLGGGLIRTSNSGAGSSTGISLLTGNSGGSGTQSGNISITSGNGTGTGTNSGNITLDVGTATGTTGTISLGSANASALILGRTGLTTTNAGALTVTQLTTLNGGLTVEAGDTFTFNGDAFTDLTGSGLTVVSNALTVDATSATGFFRNGGNSFGATATIGTNDGFALAVGTSGIERLRVTATGNLQVDTDTLFVNATTNTVGILNGAPANPLSINTLTTADSLAQVAIGTGAVGNKGLVIQGVAGQTANALEVQSNTGFAGFVVSAAGNASAASLTVYSGETTGSFRKNYIAGTGGVSAADVLVLADDGGASRVIRTTTARDTRVAGVAISTVSSGGTAIVAIAGNALVTADSGAVAIGDQLVTSSSSGQVTVDNSATTGIVGYATSSKAGGAPGTVGVYISVTNGQLNPNFTGNITVGGLTTLNGGLTVEAGDTFTLNGDAFTDLTGSGLTVVSNALTVDATSVTGFFRNGGNAFATGAVLGTNDNNSLILRTNSTTALTIDTSQNALFAGTITATGLATFNGDLRISDGSSNYATITVDPLAGDYTISIPTTTVNDEFCLRITLNCTGAGTDEVITVAADNSSAEAKAAADYVADGTSDEDEINAALTAAAGGKVVLLEGTFVADGTILVPNNTTLEGSGRGTVIELADIDATDNLIEATGTNRTGQTVKNLTIDGRNDLNTAGTQHGIRLDSVGDSATNRPGATLENITVQNFRNNGIFIFGSDSNAITGNMIQDNDGNGITLDDESEYNTVSNNIVKDNSSGISLVADSHNNTVIGNIVQASSGSHGILLTSSSNTAVANNTVSGYYFGLYFNSSSNNTITSNVAHSGEYGFWFQSTSTNNTFTANIAENNNEIGLFMGWDTDNNTVTGNIIKGNNVGVYTNSSHSTFTGNSVQGNSASGFNLFGFNNILSDNKVHDSGGSTANQGIVLNGADFNSIIDNHITDTACTFTCYAINISDAGSDKNYLEGNRFTGSAANAASINDDGTNTIYVNQQVNSTTSTNSDVSEFRFRGSANSANAFSIQNAAGTPVLNVNTSTAGVGITGTLSVSSTSTFTGLATFDGNLRISDGSSNYATIAVQSTSGDYTYTIPTTTGNDEFCLYTLNNCAGTATTLQGAYNNDADGSDAVIVLTATDGALVLRDAASTIGNLFVVEANGGSDYFAVASSGITLGINTTLAANQSLTITGGNTASRPGSPTEGMVYFDTDTDSLLVYANGKWQSDRTSVTKTVAPSNAPQYIKDSADYVADGTADQVEISVALTAAAGGKVYLFEGTFVADDTILIPNNTTLAGAGRSTVIELADIDVDKVLIANLDTSTGTGVVIQDLRLDGRSDLNTAGDQTGIRFNGMGATPNINSRQGGKITNLWIDNFRSEGIALSSSYRNTLTGNVVQSNGQRGFYLVTAADNILTDNISHNNTRGFHLGGGANRNIISNNIVRLNSSFGIVLFNTAAYNTISGNTISDSGGSNNNNGVYVSDGDFNRITNNYITDNTCNTTCYAINISDAASQNNYVADNILGIGAIEDQGTDTVYGGQVDGFGNFVIQPTGSISLLANTNITGILTVSGTSTFTGLATFNGGLTVAAGSTFTNSSSTLLTALPISDIAGGGPIGSAPATVDIATTFDINQTTVGQALTLPNPTVLTSGRIVYINNVGTATFTMYGSNVSVGGSATFIWNGSAWTYTVSFASAGVDTLAPIGSSPNANGGTITGTTLTLQPANGTYGGVVSATTQAFTGNKTFNNTLTVTGLATFNGGLTVEAGDTFTFNGDAFTDFTGGGLYNDAGLLSVVNTGATGFFQNGGNSFGTGAVLGTNDNNSLIFRTNSTTALTIDTSQNALFAGNITIQGGELNMTNGTSNIIDLGTNGTAVPSFTTRSAGTKIVLYSSLSSLDADYALGVAGNTAWSSVQRATSTYKFAWYGGTTEIATLNGEGDFALTGDLAVTGTTTLNGDTTIRANLHVRNTGDTANVMTFSQADNLSTNSDIAFNSAALLSAQDDFIINIDSNNNDANRSFIVGMNSATTGGSYAQLFQVREAGDVNIVSGALLTNNTSRLTNAGILENITGFNQTSGTFVSTLTDNTTNVFDIQEGTNNYININTTNGSENISFGNAVTNPSYNFLGAGTLSVAGAAQITGNLTVDTDTLFVDAANNRVGVGTTTLNNGVLTVSGTAPTGVASGGIFVNTTLSSITNNQSGVRSVPIVAPGSASTQSYYGFVASAVSSSSNLAGATMGGLYGGGYYDGTGTVGSMYGVYAANELDTATGSIGTAAALFAADTYTAGGTITNNYGLFVETINAGTNNYGIYVQNATTYAIWVDSGATRLDGTLEVQSATTLQGALSVEGNTTIGNATTDRLTVTSQILGGSPLVFQGATDNAFTTTFAITDPTVNRTITFPNDSGTVLLGAAGSGNAIVQVPTSNTGGTQGANIIAPIAANIVALTVNGTTGTSANALNIVQGGAAVALNISSGSTGNAQNIVMTNTTGTKTNGLYIQRNGAGGTTTNMLHLQNSAGTATNGILFTGTIGTDITTAAARNLTIITGTTGALILDSGTTGAINIGTNTGAKDVNLGTGGTGAKVVTVGSTAAASALNLRAGTGNITVQGVAATTIAIGATNQTGALTLGQSTATNTINIGNANTATGNIQTINMGAGTPAGTGRAEITIGNTANASALNLRAGTGLINLNTTQMQFTEITGTRTLTVQTRTAANAGTSLTVRAGTGNGNNTGGTLTLQGGNSGASGNPNGGNVVIAGGTGNGTGVQGLVIINTPTFNTATQQDCAANCTVTQANVDSSGAVLINATNPGINVTLPDPTITTAGRIVYVTATSGSNEFTLIVNGGGTGNEIAMRGNTTATMIWNGSDWTAGGASSSTTLQAAYNNTLTSAGAAEIVLNGPGGSADGLTIRNNATNPIMGAVFETQTSVGGNLFSVNNNATEYATNGGAETPGGSPTAFPANTWSSAQDGGTVQRLNTIGPNVATGQSSVSVSANGAGQGARNRLASALTPNMRYTVSYTIKTTANFSTLDTVYSPSGNNTGIVPCIIGSEVRQGQWTRIICSFDAPASGITANNAIFIRKSVGGLSLYYIDNLSVTISAIVNHAADGSVDDPTNFATHWTPAPAGPTVGNITRNITIMYDTNASVQVAAGNTAGHGVRNNMAIMPTTGTQYRVTFYAQSSNTFNDIRVRYSRNGGTNTEPCVDYNTRSVAVAPTWTKITCLFTTDGTAPSNPDLIIDQETAPGAGGRQFRIDALSVTLNTETASNVQIGGGSLGGPVTLLTLDRSAGPPIAANNDAYLGSMYYDTITGRIQCYESEGWGACGSPPDNIVNLNPEYAGSVLNGNGVGIMTADFCSNEVGVLEVNATLCASGEARNFYRWTSPQATEQTYSIYITYQLPGTFNGFSSDDTVQLTGRFDHAANAAVTYEMFRSENGTVTQCGILETTVTTTINQWQTVPINGNEATGCGFTPNSANAFVIFKINMKAHSNANAYVSTLTFTTTGR